MQQNWKKDQAESERCVGGGAEEKYASAVVAGFRGCGGGELVSSAWSCVAVLVVVGWGLVVQGDTHIYGLFTCGDEVVGKDIRFPCGGS